MVGLGGVAWLRVGVCKGDGEVERDYKSHMGRLSSNQGCLPTPMIYTKSFQ